MDAARRIFEEIKVKGVDLVSSWAEEGYREDLHVEFKRKAKPSLVKLSDDDRRNYSRILSGFANSDGGVVVWGIDAPGTGLGKRGKYPIRSPGRFAENLDSLVSRVVSPPVDGVENYVLLEPRSKDYGYVVSYIPKSDLAPHRAETEGLKHYYKRYGDSFKIAEHYELEYMFGKRLHPRPHVFWDVVLPQSEAGVGTDGHVAGQLLIGIKNHGRAIARFVCLRIRYDQKGFFQLSESYGPDLIHYSHPQKASRAGYLKITARAQPGLVIYPGDLMHFFVFDFRLEKEQLNSPSIGAFNLYYDLFAENFENLFHQRLAIPGKKVVDKLRKKLDDRE